MIPDYYAPPVQPKSPPDLSHLIHHIHQAIVAHPHPERKNLYGQMLAKLLQAQAKEHTTVQQPVSAGGMGPYGEGGQSAPTVPPDQTQIVTQNLGPLGWALINSGGYANANLPAHLGGAVGGLPPSVGSVIARMAGLL